MDFSSPRFSCHVIDDVLIGVHTTESPTDEDWDAWIDASRRALDGHGGCRALVVSMGANPNSKQRSKVNELFQDRPQRVAVMLDSRLARGAVTALSWFNPEIKPFNLAQFDEACNHLDIRGEMRARVRTVLAEMRAALSIG